MELYPHQKQVLEQIKNKNRCALYLDMGLGKTFIASEKMKNLNDNLVVIVCPKSVVSIWETHIKIYYPEYQVFTYNLPDELLNKSVIIINYDLIWRRPEFLKLKNFTLILDESQFIKNSKAERTRFIMKLKFSNLILCSGTPTGGKYEELLTQCKLLGWSITKETFWNMYVNYILIPINGFKMPKVIGYKNIEHLKQRLYQYGAIFMKTEEAIELPEQIDNVVKIENTKEYKQFKADRIITLEDKQLIGDTSLTRLLYLRQLASQYNKNKIQALKDIIESTNDRLIVFYNFNEERKLITKLCTDKNISIVCGDMKDLTNYEKHSNSVTFVQYQAGATGLNLQKANKIIYFSLPLSSELFEQSKKRIHRIGQKNNCMYYYLITENSIEEKIHETLKQRKDYTDELFKKEEI